MDEPLGGDLHEGYTVLDSEVGIFVSSDGTIYTRPARDEEDAAYLERKWQEYIALHTDPGYDPGIPDIAPAIHDAPTGHESQDAEDDGQVTDWHLQSDPDGAPTVTRTRGIIRCGYTGCRAIINDEEYTCPNPIEGQPDDKSQVFCTMRCAASYAAYEIGDPFADSILDRLAMRNGGVPLQLLPTPVAMLEFGMGGLITRQEAHRPDGFDLFVMGPEVATRRERAARDGGGGKSRRRAQDAEVE